MHNDKVNIPDFEPPFSSFITELAVALPYLLAIFILTLFSEFALLLIVIPLYIGKRRISRQSTKVKEYIDHYKATYLDPIPLSILEPAIAQKCLEDNVRPEIYSQYLARRKKNNPNQRITLVLQVN